MKVLHLDSGRELRGGQWQVLQLMTGLRRSGWQGTLLARAGTPLFEKARQAQLDVHPLSMYAVATRSRQCDLVHAHDARTHSLSALVVRKPFVVSRRVDFPIGAGPLSRWKYSRPTRFLAISEAVRNRLQEAGVPPERVDIVFDGVELPVLGGYNSDGPIVALDSSDPLKGGRLLRAAAHRAAVTVTFARDLSRAFASARLFLYISQSEGLGSAALLAMASGIPVIASAVGGLPEIVRDGETGLLCDNEPEAIASAIRRLEDDPETAHRLGAAGRALVASRFTVDAMVHATRAVYEKVLECSK